MVAAELARRAITPERVAAEYDATQADWTSPQGWVRIEEIVFRFPGPGRSGVLACDELLHRYQRCAEKRADDSTLGILIGSMATEYEHRAAKGPAAQSALAVECLDRAAGLKKAKMLACAGRSRYRCRGDARG